MKIRVSRDTYHIAFLQCLNFFVKIVNEVAPVTSIKICRPCVSICSERVFLGKNVLLRLQYGISQRVYNNNHLSRLVGKPTMWFPNRSDTNRPVQLQNQARSLTFWILEEEGVYYPCSENKGADQLRSNCEADLRLCFGLCRLLVFSCGGSL